MFKTKKHPSLELFTQNIKYLAWTPISDRFCLYLIFPGVKLSTEITELRPPLSVHKVKTSPTILFLCAF